MRRRSTLAALAGGAALAAAGVALAQWRLQRAIAADPDCELIFRPLGGERIPVDSAEGTELNVKAFGPPEAPKLLLVHGWMCTLEFWRLQIHGLAEEFRVIAYDQRGHGESAEADDYSLESFADDLGCVLDACVPEGERTLVAAHSMGAMTTVAWAGRNPELVARRISGAVLLNTGLGDLISEAVLFRAPKQLHGLRDPLGRLLMTADAPIPPGPSPITDAFVRYVAMSPGASPAKVAFCRRMLLSSNPDVRGAAGKAMERMDLWHAIEEITVPTTVIAGEMDKLTPPPQARRLAEALPDLASYEELPGVGHMGAIEAPDAVDDAIRALASGVAGPSRAPARTPSRPRRSSPARTSPATPPRPAVVGAPARRGPPATAPPADRPRRTDPRPPSGTA
jgi:pimeloyl-ACP methyl ester carboxylesterase